jgi:integrase
VVEGKPGVADCAVQAAIWRSADTWSRDIASTHRRIAKTVRMFDSGAILHQRARLLHCWLGHVTVPKGGRSRQLPLTQRLTAALKAARHLRCERVLCLPDGSPITRDRVIKAVRGAQRIAGIEQGVHIQRHTFCSHLAMKGAPARAIQESAGHADLSTTQRYMHLSPAATEDAIRLLDGRSSDQGPAKAGHHRSDADRAENLGDIPYTREATAGSN